MTIPARDRNDERVVPDTRIRRAPRRQIWTRIRPADPDHAGFGSLPAICAAARPVVCVSQRNTTDAILACDINRTFHTEVGIQVSRSGFAIPTFHRSGLAHELGGCVHVNHACLDHRHKEWEPIYPMGIDTVSAGFSEQLRASTGAPSVKTGLRQCPGKSIEEI